MSIKLFGLVIERKTDFIALAAFFLAFSSFIAQIIFFFQGPNVKLFPPEQILIKADIFPNAGNYVRFGARMAYVNSAFIGYNDSIRKETISFVIEDNLYEQAWQTFESFDLQDEKLKSSYYSDAHPTPVNAGSSTSHETYFSPRSIRCKKNSSDCNKWINYLKFDEFIDKVTKINKLYFKFKSYTYSDKVLEVNCFIDVDDALIARLKQNRWAAPACWTNED